MHDPPMDRFSEGDQQRAYLAGELRKADNPGKQIHCWSCRGSGTIRFVGFVDTVDGPEPGPDPERPFRHVRTCDRCGGLGRVPEDMPKWVNQGRMLRERRIALGYRVGDVAGMLRVGASQVSAAEFGRINPQSIEYGRPTFEHLCCSSGDGQGNPERPGGGDSL